MIVENFDSLDTTMINTSVLSTTDFGNTNYEVESRWYSFHKLLMTLGMAFHSVSSAVILCMIIMTIFSSNTYTMCKKYSEITFGIYFLINFGFAITFFINYRNAKEMDIILLRKTRNTLFITCGISPLMYVGSLTPSVLCKSVPAYNEMILNTHTLVLHLLVESGVLGLYFWFYLRHVKRKELFTRPYNTGIKI